MASTEQPTAVQSKKKKKKSSRFDRLQRHMASLLLRRWLSRALRNHPASPITREVLVGATPLRRRSATLRHPFPLNRRCLCSGSLNLDSSHGPAAIDYSSLLQEDEFHGLANSTIQHLQEKCEEYGDSIDIDGFDVDYGNDVLTIRLGDLGTYVLNKQTPNRQIWLSSPVSGPSRFDWDPDTKGWIYRRNKANLMTVLETELEKLCGSPIQLS